MTSEALAVRVLIAYGQEAFPVVTMQPVGTDDHPEDRDAAVSVPAAAWRRYVAAQRELARAESAIVARDPEKPPPGDPCEVATPPWGEIPAPAIEYEDYTLVETLRCWPAEGMCRRVFVFSPASSGDWRAWDLVREAGWAAVEQGVGLNASRVWRCPEHGQ